MLTVSLLTVTLTSMLKAPRPVGRDGRRGQGPSEPPQLSSGSPEVTDGLTLILTVAVGSVASAVTPCHRQSFPHRAARLEVPSCSISWVEAVGGQGRPQGPGGCFRTGCSLPGIKSPSVGALVGGARPSPPCAKCIPPALAVQAPCPTIPTTGHPETSLPFLQRGVCAP